MTMTINGSGTVTGLTAGGLPDGTVQQADLALGVAGTGPAFSVYATATRSLPHATPTKIPLDTVAYNVGGGTFDAVNNRWTPTVAGYYLFEGLTALLNPAATGVSIAYLYKNGVLIKRGQPVYCVTTDGPMCSIVSLVFMNGTTDYIELWGYQGTGAALSTTSFTAGSENRLEGYLARSI